MLQREDIYLHIFDTTKYFPTQKAHQNKHAVTWHDTPGKTNRPGKIVISQMWEIITKYIPQKPQKPINQ